MGKDIGPAPDRADRAQASLVEHLQRIQLRIKRFCTLEMQNRREHALAQAVRQLVGRSYHLHLIMRLGLDPKPPTRARGRSIWPFVLWSKKETPSPRSRSYRLSKVSLWPSKIGSGFALVIRPSSRSKRARKNPQRHTKQHEHYTLFPSCRFVCFVESISRRRLATPRASGHPRLGRRCPAVRADRSAGRPCYSQCAAAAARATPMRAGVASPA